MFGEAWASLAEKVFGWVTDDRGLAEFKKRRNLKALEKEIHNALAQKDYHRAAAALDDLKRMSDAP
jgi:hypothetical protein